MEILTPSDYSQKGFRDVSCDGKLTTGIAESNIMPIIYFYVILCKL